MYKDRIKIAATVSTVYSNKERPNDIVILEDVDGNEIVGITGNNVCKLRKNTQVMVSDAPLVSNLHLVTHALEILLTQLGTDRIVLDLNSDICSRCPIGGKAKEATKHCRIYNPNLD